MSTTLTRADAGHVRGRTTRRIALLLIEPLAAAAVFCTWFLVSAPPVVTYVQIRGDMTVTNPYSVAIAAFFAAALALTRLSPGVSIGIVALSLAIQFLGWASRFSDTGWTAYLMLAAVALALSVHATGRIRKLAVVLALPMSVAISALLTLPEFSLSGTFGLVTGQGGPTPEVLASFGIWAFVALLVGAVMWWLPAWLRNLVPTAAEPAATADIPAVLSGLSARERDVYLWVAEGMSNAEIANVAHIEESTVKTHISRILTKLNLSSRTAVIAHAYRFGVLRPETPELS